MFFVCNRWFKGCQDMLVNQRGTTIKEVIVVMLIIAGFVFLSIPAFFYLRNQAQEKGIKELVSQLKSQIAAWHYKGVIMEETAGFPPFLDSNPYPAPCIQCFEGVLGKPINDEKWFKNHSLEYRYANTWTLFYVPQTGKIILEQAQ